MDTGSDRTENAGAGTSVPRPAAFHGGTTSDGMTGGDIDTRTGEPSGVVTRLTDESDVEGSAHIQDNRADDAPDECDAGEQSVGYALKTKVVNFNRFIDETAKGLDPISAMVWLTLFRFARGGIAWASQETIADRLGMNPTTVYRHIRILKAKKLLRVVKNGRRGGHANTYQLGITVLEPVAKRPERSSRKPR